MRETQWNCSWADPSCFELKRGQFGPQRRGPDGWQIRPRYPGNSLVADTRFGYPAFYVRDFLEGEEKFIRGYNLTVYEKFKRLPVRTHLSPYLLFFKPTFCGDDGIACPRLIEDLVKKRNDIIWVGHDLDGMRLGRPGYTLPGITIPGELGSTITYAWRYRGRPKHPHKHYLTFQGKCPSRQHAAQWHMNYSVRGELNRLFNEVNEDNFGSNPRKGLPNGVKYVCVDRQKGRVSSDKEVNRRYHDILDTDYALVPRGDERWSFRFLEAVGAGAIPVVVADGLSLPYDNVRMPSSFCFLPNFVNSLSTGRVLSFASRNKRCWK